MKVFAVARGLLATAAAALLAVAVLGAPAIAQSTLGQGGGVVTSLTLFGGTAAGLVVTRDWGATWSPAQAVPSGKSLEELKQVRAILPIGSRVYAGGAGGLFVSDDFGLTWARFAEDRTVLAVLPSRYPQADPTLFLGTDGGLLKSLDGGKTWLETALRGTPVFRIEWPGPALIVATGRGVFVSSDAGATFSGPGKDLPDGEVRALALSSYFAIDPVMFAGVRGRGVFRSSDGGASWHAAGLEGREVNDLAWPGPVLYAATDEGVRRTENLGRNWAALDHGLTGKANRLMFPLLPDSGAVVFVATEEGVFRSEDGGSNWQPSGMKGQDVFVIATFPAPDRAPSKQPRR